LNMKIKNLFVLCAVAISGVFAPALQAETPKLVVAILVDQLRYDYLERFDQHFTTNGFKTFTEQGAFLTFARYPYYPTKTAPGHATFLSGSGPSVHGVIENDWFDKKTRRSMYCVEDKSVQGVGTASPKGQMSPRNFMGTTFSDSMRTHYGSKVIGISMKDRGAVLPAGKKPTGAYWFESKSGLFVSSTYYMTELPAWMQEFNARKLPASYIGKTWKRLLDPKHYTMKDDAISEGKLAGEKTSTFDHVINDSKGEGAETIMPTPFGNEVLVELAKAAIEGEKLGQGTQPDVLCVSFSSIDYSGHLFGPASQEVMDMTLRLDRQLADLFTYLDAKIGMKNVTMVLTSDHGVAPIPEQAAQNGFDAGRLKDTELMVDLLGKLDQKFGPGKYFLNPKPVEGNLYFNHEVLQEKKLAPTELCNFIREWALDTGKFQAVYSREQLLDGRTPGHLGQLVFNGYNVERSGDVVMVTKPFLLMSGYPSGTSHGTPYSYDTHVPVCFYGAAFKPGRYADEFYITDIAPTLAAALRVEQPAASVGKPFVKALKP
jgi:predicted AlkP superfamily pyrophosphatase or phosphodiesterase